MKGTEQKSIYQIQSELVDIIYLEPNMYTEVYKGYTILINRGPLLILCGYVGVNKEHPLYNKDYRDDGNYTIYSTLDVHGGITFTDFKNYYKYLPENLKDLYFIGFDCGHYLDITPIRAFSGSTCSMFQNGEGGFTYKDFEYVLTECKNLVEQLKEIKTKKDLVEHSKHE